MAAAADAQAGLRHGPLSVRMGLHTGKPTPAEEGYVGLDVHRGARIAAVAHGGQIVLSSTTRDDLPPEQPVRDLGEHRLKDLAEPEWLFQVGDEEFPPLRSLAVTNLPVPATALVGRRAELAGASALLERPSTRLLTVLGPGGVGKTRIAIALARDALGRFPNGVFFVPLASVREPALVLPAVARTLAVADEPGRALVESLAAHLAGRRLLLLLDNVEHVLDAATELSALLASTEGLTVLATSREPLRILGEVTYELEPLGRDDAVALFLERAPAVEPSEAVERLVTRLDCLPLALELAAARTRLLSLPELLERLGRRLDLQGRRDADARQRTLRTTIEWSYELLDPREAALFARLSVFVGGFTLGAAETVCDADVDRLESLLDKSLLRRGVAGGETRLSMLETIREFAVERLEERGEADDVRGRHAEFVLCAALEDAPVPPERPAAHWLERLEHERENVRAALAWLADHDVDGLAGLVLALAPAWGASAEIREAAARTERALACEEPDLRTRMLGVASGVAFAQADYERARALAEEQLARARAGLSDATAVVVALGNLAAAFSYLGDPDRATALLEEALEVGVTVDPRWRRLKSNLVPFALVRGDFERAVALGDDAIAVARELGDEETLMMTLANKAFACVELGRSEAEPLFAEALRRAGTLRNVRVVAYALSGLAATAATRGDAERAVGLAAATDAICDETGLTLEPLEARRHAATLAAARDALGEQAFASAWAAGAALGLDGAVDFALNGISEAR